MREENGDLDHSRANLCEKIGENGDMVNDDIRRISSSYTQQSIFLTCNRSEPDFEEIRSKIERVSTSPGKLRRPLGWEKLGADAPTPRPRRGLETKNIATSEAER